MGKTLLAILYAYQKAPYYPGGVFWINASEPSSIIRQVDDLAMLVGFEPGAKDDLYGGRASRWLEQQFGQRKDVLLIIDNLDDDRLLIDGLPSLPDVRLAAFGCRLLVTSRLKAIPGCESVYVDFLSPSDDEQLQSRESARKSDRGDQFQQLSPRARDVFSFAQEIAKASKSDSVHTEELIVGLAFCGDAYIQRIFRRFWSNAIPTVEGRIPPPPELPQRAPSISALPRCTAHVRQALDLTKNAMPRSANTPIEPRHLLFGLLSIDECSVAKALRGLGLTSEIIDLDTAQPRPIAGYSADSCVGEDRLGFKRDVEVLSALLAYQDLEPPLSIGLFGNWGSGKSFFMEQMKKELEMLQGTDEYCSRIVQISFNAWHYIDSENLWASLVAEIFEQLAVKIGERNKKDPEQLRTRLMAACSSAVGKRATRTMMSFRPLIE
jgi:hypothetical protein